MKKDMADDKKIGPEQGSFMVKVSDETKKKLEVYAKDVNTSFPKLAALFIERGVERWEELRTELKQKALADGIADLEAAMAAKRKELEALAG